MNYKDIEQQIDDLIGELKHVESMHTGSIAFAKEATSLQERLERFYEERDRFRKILQDIAIRSHKLMNELIKDIKKDDVEYYNNIYYSGADIVSLSSSVISVIRYVSRVSDLSSEMIEKLNSLAFWLMRAQIAVDKINDALVDELGAAVKDFTKKFKSIDEHLAVLDYLVVQARIDKAISGNGNGEGTPTP